MTASTAGLTDLLKKDNPWKWTPEHQKMFEEIKTKMTSAPCLGVPRPLGEFLLVTDASNVGGGGSFFQWQSLTGEERNAIPHETIVTGVLPNGVLRKENDLSMLILVPLGHWNWKWSGARSRYATYEQELLAGILVLSGQSRIFNRNKIAWLCDQKAVESF